ncbi:LacI family DNA-binding transcriptional regulator [Amycolatopsis sp. NPDC051128]|uniref:LacI family DNA-binding transcriptional regulator n=1 Tax=Amycolatopsis sp. NPDC051128 TaxID=3155412 RepID=UPI0034136E6E
MSTVTVSNALNGTGRLSDATRQRVLAIVADIGDGSRTDEVSAPRPSVHGRSTHERLA